MSANVSNENDSAHDPLCPFWALLEKHTGVSVLSCQCNLIARVREDDRRRLKEIGLRISNEKYSDHSDWMYEPIKQYRRDVLIAFHNENLSFMGKL